MLVQQLLLETLEELRNDDFKMLKWYLSLKILDGCKPIAKSRLETASRAETVSRMSESYGEESAVSVTAAILKKMNFNGAAVRLQNTYAEGQPATPSTSSSAVAPPAAAEFAAPAKLSAQHGSVIIAPTVAGGTSGTWNITIHK
ncbi:NACHT, LRR and PYD domains-containing protein 10-like [Enoplosus armatus]|uniref:NACHT, LRR and PYD domains-containing protein 10-like n=1 Tax=Enoplosus armatus TaxID=215367 RepID=UPI003992976B